MFGSLKRIADALEEHVRVTRLIHAVLLDEQEILKEQAQAAIEKDKAITRKVESETR